MPSLNGFDANTVDPATDFEPLPAGKYPAVIVDSEMKTTKSGDGHYLELRFQLLEGPHKNRMLWSRLNLDNPSRQAVQIAQAQLSAICRAVGVMQPKDSLELHNLPLTIGVRLKRRSDTDELTNEIRSYSKKEDAAGLPVQADTNAPPWRRG
jgi:hypothetical protein